MGILPFVDPLVVCAVHENRVMVHKVKVGVDGHAKRKQAWDLEELKLIDGISESPVC